MQCHTYPHLSSPHEIANHVIGTPWSVFLISMGVPMYDLSVKSVAGCFWVLSTFKSSPGSHPGKWCRPTDPTDPTMLILSARHTLLITLLILSAHRVDYCADTLLITRHQFDTFSKAHTSAPAWRGEPPCKKEHLKHYKAVCVMLC